MGLSSKSFLLSADDTLQALASTAFMRMLRREDVARVPDFAVKHVRQASRVVEVVDGKLSLVVHGTTLGAEALAAAAARLDEHLREAGPAALTGTMHTTVQADLLAIGCELGALSAALGLKPS